MRIDLQTNVVTITPDPHKEFDLATIPERIRETGFRPDEMRLAARGATGRDGSALRFRISNWRRTLPIVGVDPDATSLEDVRVEYDERPLRLVADR